MFAIIVTEKGGDQRRLEFDKSEVTIGRVQGNDVILPKGNVSKRHARIVLKDGKFIIVDLKSTNGTYVNGRKITSPLVVKDNDKIYIGDFILGVDGAAARSGPSVDSGSYGAPPPAPEPIGGPPSRPSPPPGPPPPMGGPLPMGGPPPLGSPPPPMGGAPLPIGSPPASLGGPPPARPLPPPGPPPSIGPPDSIPPIAPLSGPPTGPAMSGSPGAPMSSLGGPPPPAPPVVTPPRERPQARPAAAAPRPTVQAPLRVAPKTRDNRGKSQPRLVGAGAPRGASVRPASALPSRGTPIEPLDPKAIRTLELQETILDRLVPRLDLDNIPIERLGDESLWQKAESAIVDLVETLDSSGELPPFVDQDTLIKETLNEALGLGPLEDLLADDSIEEIIVDRRDRILITRSGAISGSGRAFSSDETFRRVVERLVAPTGHLISEASPLVDVRLRDGSRLAAAVPPVAVRGACLTLRKPRVSTYSLGDLVSGRSVSASMADFLATCVSARRNILVCGAPASGKSMVLTALANAVPPGERIVSVEEVAELSLGRDEWIALEARPSDGNGVAEVNLDMVLHSALRMRADRLVIGDVRGAEALELISAMSSSSDGSLVSIAGDGAQSALARLTAMARLAAPGASTDAIRELVSCAIDVVVHVARYADDVVRVASISEVMGVGEGGFEVQDVFSFRGSANEGGFTAAGVVPSFYDELEARGLPADTSIFNA